MKEYWRVRYKTGGTEIYATNFVSLQTKEQLREQLQRDCPVWEIVSIVHVIDAERQKAVSSGQEGRE